MRLGRFPIDMIDRSLGHLPRCVSSCTVVMYAGGESLAVDMVVYSRMDAFKRRREARGLYQGVLDLSKLALPLAELT